MDWFNNARKLIWTYLREDMNDSDVQKEEGTPREGSSTDDLLLWCTNIQEIGTLRSEEHSSSSNDVHAQNLEWKYYLDKMFPNDKEKILSFLFEDDQNRCFVSIMMQRAMIRKRLGVKDDTGYTIEKTRENKPYARTVRTSRAPPSPPLESWNYNVSHHGQYVCIAAHTKFLVGVDLVDISTRSKNVLSFDQYLGYFEKCFGDEEIEALKREVTEEERYTLFFVYWALKESYIKAIGLGLGFDVKNVCFKVAYHIKIDPQADIDLRRMTGTATAVISGSDRPHWRFDFFSLDDRHVMAVAQGPLGEDKGEENGGENGERNGGERGSERGGKGGEERSGVIGDGKGGEKNGVRCVDGSIEGIEYNMNYPIKASKCFFVPLRNFLPSLMRKEIEKLFPLPNGLINEDILYDIDEMELKYDLLKSENENCNLFDKNNCEKCFSVCCII